MNIAEKIRRSNIEVHSREAAIYDAIHPEIFGSFEQRKILRDLDLIASIMHTHSAVRVLDIGCGTGNLTIKFVKQGYSVRAVDISPAMINILQSKIDRMDAHSVELVVGDAEDIIGSGTTHGSWQIISFSSVLHHLPDYTTVLANAVRQLGAGGVLYICHEPLRQPRSGSGLASRLGCKMLNGIDTLYIYGHKLLVYCRQSLRSGRFFQRVDYRWSDYHSRSGIDAQQILRHLVSTGAKILLYETYRSRYSSLLATLDAGMGISEHSHFRLIAQR